MIPDDPDDAPLGLLVVVCFLLVLAVWAYGEGTRRGREDVCAAICDAYVLDDEEPYCICTQD